MTDDGVPQPFPLSKLGEYTVIQDIAEGTFGIVKMARHTVTGHIVAMKYISKALIHKTRTKTRVQREVEYMRALRHPHIIKLYEVISTPTDIIIVLEYVGGELFKYIVQHGRMSERKGRRFFQQLISGIEYSHKLKIVHRDLKPENVLLDSDLNVKIADFGLSNEIRDGDFLKTSCGSPNYAAPEVISGGLYTGPEIDVWSSGVILYVMLCGSLPFEDDDVKALFHKISLGIFHMPSYLSNDAKHLISAMLMVDPLRRITIPEVTQHPFFTSDLPAYLTPLPPPPGPVLGQLSALAALPPSCSSFELIEGLGRIEEDVIEDLASKLEEVSEADIWEALRRDDGAQGNAVKIAYMLLRDKKREGQDLAVFEESEREALLVAMDPRNATSPALMTPQGTDVITNPFEKSLSNGLSADSPPTDLEEPDELDLSPPLSRSSSANNFAVLNTSLQNHPSHNLRSHADYASAKRAGKERDKVRRHNRTKWHFGIRSRSPPMEIMLEIYRALEALGMEWKEKRTLGGLGGIRRRSASYKMEQYSSDGSEYAENEHIERKSSLDGDEEIDMKSASGIFFIETRARARGVVVLMNLQLYQVDHENYLVDFHHKSSYLASTEPDAGKFDKAPFPPQSPSCLLTPTSETLPTLKEEAEIPVTGPTAVSFLSSGVLSTSGDSTQDVSPRLMLNEQGQVGACTKRRFTNADGEDVVSPFVFMDVASRLILELAGGSAAQ
ncbi:kinase-like domain-containing protein [Pterulicium gracile]|uniref:non-specific serine/threonine protein kinase n=1 Tax=Pterulicium gracile TaxID=1884261 RepID=A0A5C3QBR4_9AGAR|nr:kinase-like domain-containing protein [Pterula gracilis]